MSYGIGHRCSSDLTLLWLWCSLAAAAPIQPLAWEPPYTMGVALKKNEMIEKISIRDNTTGGHTMC